MKRIYIFILLSTSLFAQTTLNDLDRLSNRQLDDLRNKLISQNIDNNSITSIDGMSQPIEDVKISVDKVSESSESKFFGYSYFENNINFYDNIPTPSSYKLGPGDEIMLSLWGETNLRETFTINKEGLIYFKNIGFINLSNKTLKEAEEVLVIELSRVFSTLNSDINPTNLMIELGKLKSLNVYFTGHVKKPGINLVHPFSDVFSAIVQAGGIDNSGSLRSIKIIRENKEVLIIDFYDFFVNGKNNFKNFKILDGDIIHVPPVLTRVALEGEVVSPGRYELMQEETVSDLLDYAGGLSTLAANSALFTDLSQSKDRIYDDYAFSTKNIFYNNYNDIELTNGDKIKVLSVLDVDSMVQVYGMVKNPGKFSSSSNLKDVLDLAGGFNDPIFKQSIHTEEITILRRDSTQLYSKVYVVNYNDSKEFSLLPGDKILVYENSKYNNNLTYKVEGEVSRPGVYPLSSNVTTVREALSAAGGLTSLSSTSNIIVRQEFSSIDEEGNTITSFETVSNADLDFEIGANSIIIASKYENVVRIKGNVYNSGLVAFDKKLRYPHYIELAGGYKPNSLKRKSYIIRSNGEIVKVNGFFISRGKRVYAGDTIVVPLDDNPSDFEITRFISDLSSTIANIVAIILVVDNQK